MEVREEEVVIVGGGIAGLATALALKRVGFNSLVLERHTELRSTGAALALFPNAWFALRALGVDHKLTSVYQPFKKSKVTNLETGATQEFDFTGTKERSRITNLETGTTKERLDVGVRAVHRKALLQALAEELPPETIRFSSKLISIKNETLPDASKITVLHLDDGTIIKAKVVIGCDGVHSVVAQWLGLSQPIRSGRAAIRGLSVFPQGHGFNHEVYQYLGPDIRAGYTPLNHTELYWFIVNHSPSSDEGVPASPELLLKEIMDEMAKDKDLPTDFLTVVRHTDLSTLTWAPLLFRVPWNVAFGRAHNGPVTVAGDAMHPMTPELGQGGCCALEDAVVLARCISRARATASTNQRWAEEGLKRYVEERRWRVTWLVAGACVSGWVQLGGRGNEWWSGIARWFRDHIFYKFIITRIADSIWYDCGELGSTK